MTREEAIETLKRAVEILKSEAMHESELAEALKMAMRSLNAWDELKEKIETYKSLLYLDDLDFYRGQISALSAVQCFVEQSLHEVES